MWDLQKSVFKNPSILGMMLAGLLYFYLKGRRNLPPQCSEWDKSADGPRERENVRTCSRFSKTALQHADNRAPGHGRPGSLAPASLEPTPAWGLHPPEPADPHCWAKGRRRCQCCLNFASELSGSSGFWCSEFFFEASNVTKIKDHRVRLTEIWRLTWPPTACVISDRCLAADETLFYNQVSGRRATL